MLVTVLGSAGSEAPGQNPPAFLIDDFLLLDAGTVSRMLDTAAQCKITHIFLTHAHFDHIKAIPFLVDNFVSVGRTCRIEILSGREIISALRKNIFNDSIWPDFSVIPDDKNPVMTYRVIGTREPIAVGGYLVHATKVNHSVPAYGYLVEDSSGNALLYTGDTGPTGAIWKKMRGRNVKVLIIEVSFPNEMRDLAIKTGHLTPLLLQEEILKMPRVPERIYISHLKPHYRSQIQAQLAQIRGAHLEVLGEGTTFTLV